MANVIFEDVLRQLLLNANVVGGNRVFFMRAPQKPAEMQVVPYMIFFGVGPSPMHCMTGPLMLLDREYQVSIFDSSQSRATLAADNLRAQIDGVRGDFLGIRFGGIFYRSQTSAFESTPELVQVIQTYRILFTVLDSFQTLTLNPSRNHRQIIATQTE